MAKVRAPRGGAAVDRTIERSIYFFRANCGLEESGRPIPLNIAPALRHIDQLDYDENGRYLKADEDTYTCCAVDRHDGRPQIRLWNSRRGNLPQVDSAGDLSALPIPAGAGIAETTHIVFFPHNIVGADFNFYGPRVTRLTYYLKGRCEGHCLHTDFEPLIRNDVLTQLDRIRHIRMFSLRVHPAFAEAVTQANESLGAAFAACANVGRHAEVEVVLQVPRSMEGSLPQGILTAVRRLTRRADLRTNATHFVVSGPDVETGRMRTLDLLNDKLISRKLVVVEDARTRALNSRSAYQAIEQAYDELAGELMVAAGVAI